MKNIPDNLTQEELIWGEGPLMKDCPTCGGTGLRPLWFAKQKIRHQCEDCLGEGEVQMDEDEILDEIERKKEPNDL